MTNQILYTSDSEINALIVEFLSSSEKLPVSNGKYTVFPGFCDVHVHFREPGFSYKETIESGSYAAAHGGYSAACTMPNLSPVPDCLENLEVQLKKIKEGARISVTPYGAVSVGELGREISDMESMAPFVCGFSDDGRGVQDRGLMREAMQRAASLGKIIAAHCEDNSLVRGGVIHDGEYAAKYGYVGIPSESEYKQIERDLVLAADTGCAYHVCHISAKESVELIRAAKADGVDVSCETAPHYLCLCDADLIDDGRFKMNPPIRGKADRDALIEGVCDGTVDIIATDHAPHSAEEKSRGLKSSLMGISGIETSFASLYTYLVKSGKLSAERLTELMCTVPRKRFGIMTDPGFTVFETASPYTLCEKDFLSMGKSNPFIGRELYGKCILTVYLNKTVYTVDTDDQIK